MYQQLAGGNDDQEEDINNTILKLKQLFRPDFFDLIIVDDERVIIRTKLEKPSKIKGLALI